MAQFIAMSPDVEVNGETVNSVVDGMGAFRAKALDILAKNGIKDPKPGLWYNQQNWLKAFEEISKTIGAHTLYAIGLKIPDDAKFPPDVDNIEKALGAIDVAFHMNHRIKGKPLFDPATGKMTEGIGHYNFKMVGGNEGVMTCPNSYPCDFDRGIIDGMVAKFKPTGSHPSVRHDDSAPCRKSGADSCTYRIRW